MNRERILQTYIGALGLAVVIILSVCAIQVAHMTRNDLFRWALPVLLLLLFGVITSGRSVVVGESSAHYMGTLAHVATVILLPLPMALLTVTASKVMVELHLMSLGERRWRHLSVNTSASALANAAGGTVFLALGGPTWLWRHDLQAILGFPAVTALVLAYFVVESMIVVGAIAITKPGDNFLSIVRTVSPGTMTGEFTLALIGTIFAVIAHSSPVLSLLIIPPVIWSFQAFESLAKLRKETVDSVLAMAKFIDYRDTGTFEHSERLVNLAARLAAILELLPESIDEIVLAAKVHDLGKIGISNEILLKDGPLTVEERTTMQAHPGIGAEILSSYSAIKDSVQQIVKYHHERWDGAGYPEGLAREKIPIGSRIICVVDSYDAMTANRPYRTGMSSDKAVERLKDGIGTQFDPRVCAKFIELLIEEGTYAPPNPALDLQLVPQGVTSTG